MTLIIDVLKNHRSDVPIAFTLVVNRFIVLTSVASKILNLKFKLIRSLMMIEDMMREKIKQKQFKCHNRQVKVKYENSLDDLRNITSYQKNH